MRKLAAAVLFAIAGALMLLAVMSLTNVWQQYQDSPDSTYIEVAALWLLLGLASMGAGFCALHDRSR